MRSNLVLSIRAEYGRVTCPCGGMPHNKDYTTLLPNIGFYDINTSTNKCSSGAKGRPKTTYYVVYTLHFSRQKREEKTEKCQRGLKTAKYLAELLHAVQNIRNAVKNGLVSVLGFCTVVSYFCGCILYSRFLLFLRANSIYVLDKTNFVIFEITK